MEFEIECRGRERLNVWVEECRSLCEPNWVHWCDGSEGEYGLLCHLLQADGSLVARDSSEGPGSYAYHSKPHDNGVVRTHVRTICITCTRSEADAGPTNIWQEPAEAKRHIAESLAGSMRGRTMYVIPYLMGTPDSPYRRAGIEVTDSPFRVLALHRMVRVGYLALKQLGSSGSFMPRLHVSGNAPDANSFLYHFPEERLTVSYGSDSAGSADLFADKCSALRVASGFARGEGWLPAHAAIVELESPLGDRTCFAAILSSETERTNLAMLDIPADLAAEGWAVRTFGNDIAWMHVGIDGRLWAINPEVGFSGVVPDSDSPLPQHLRDALKHNALFVSPTATDSGDPVAQPTSRFIVAAEAFSHLSMHRDDPQGVPISGILFGGRCSERNPLVVQSLSWEHGVFYGATMAAETPDLPWQNIPRDPMAMGSSCGSHIADYLALWLEIGKRLGKQAPPIFQVDFSRRDATTGEPLWPGNDGTVRLLLWMRERIAGRGDSHLTALGEVPTPSSLPFDALGLSLATISQLLTIDISDWKDEASRIDDYLRLLGDRLPTALHDELRALDIRLISRWLNGGHPEGDIKITGACGRSLVERRATDGRLMLLIQPSTPNGAGISPCTRCRRDCIGDLLALEQERR